MSAVCWFSLATILGIGSLACLALASSTNYWFIHNKNESSPQTNASAADPDKFAYPYHMGLWLTCYDGDIPDTVQELEILKGNCVLDYNFRNNHIEDFARTSVVCITLACGIILIAGVVGFSGCVCRKQTPLLAAGIFLYVSCITTLIGLCTFFGRILLEDGDISVSGNKFGWSFYVACASLGLQLVTASFVLGATRGCGRAFKAGDDF